MTSLVAGLVGCGVGDPTAPPGRPPRPRPPEPVREVDPVGDLTGLDAATRRCFTDTRGFEPLPPPAAGSWRVLRPEPAQDVAQYLATRPNVPAPPRDRIVLMPLGHFPFDVIADEDFVGLVGKSVINRGSIVAPQGAVGNRPAGDRRPEASFGRNRTRLLPRDRYAAAKLEFYRLRPARCRSPVSHPPGARAQRLRIIGGTMRGRVLRFPPFVPPETPAEGSAIFPARRVGKKTARRLGGPDPKS